MSDAVRCFLLEPLDRAALGLRRYRYSSTERCGIPANSYCNAIASIGEAPVVDGKHPHSYELAPFVAFPDHEDPRWPAACEACGRPFGPEDQWQDWYERLYRRSDTGEEVTLRNAPAGAMWYADWFAERGPDGHCLVVKTPGGEWLVDGPASNGPGWTRTGVPPLVTARPSIAIGEPMHYHGYLTDGVLVPC